MSGSRVNTVHCLATARTWLASGNSDFSLFRNRLWLPLNCLTGGYVSCFPEDWNSGVKLTSSGINSLKTTWTAFIVEPIFHVFSKFDDWGIQCVLYDFTGRRLKQLWSFSLSQFCILQFNRIITTSDSYAFIQQIIETALFMRLLIPLINQWLPQHEKLPEMPYSTC